MSGLVRADKKILGKEEYTNTDVDVPSLFLFLFRNSFFSMTDVADGVKKNFWQKKTC